VGANRTTGVSGQVLHAVKKMLFSVGIFNEKATASVVYPDWLSPDPDLTLLSRPA
jgi:hypothetical protein